ncbi:MAG: hypothetical protein ACOCYB_01760 [Alkalispirochaeta sp.]
MSDRSAPEINRSAVDLVIHTLRAGPVREPREVDRIYRRLLREVHPDRFGDDGTLFRYVREQFSTLRAEWALARARTESAASVDRTRILVELGLSTELSARPALLAALYRFRALGLAHYRVRSRPALRARNTQVIRSVVVWAYEYDPAFVPLFYKFLRNQGNFSLSERYAPLYGMVRKLVLQGLDGLIRYQDRPRRATAEIAHDKIRYALEISREYNRDPAFSAVHGVARWIEKELGAPPEPIGLDR